MEQDLHCSHGPVSSLPGSSHPLPEGTVCDTHQDRLAVKRIQGETDSFGAEYNCMCQECLDAYRKAIEEERNTPQRCDWCGNMKLGLRSRRDYDEGMSGRVYDVCGDCISADNERARQELEDDY